MLGWAAVAMISSLTDTFFRKIGIASMMVLIFLDLREADLLPTHTDIMPTEQSSPAPVCFSWTTNWRFEATTTLLFTACTSCFQDKEKL